MSSVGTQVDPPNLSIVKASNLTLAKSMVEIARATDASCQTEREGTYNLCNHLVQVLKDTQKGKDVPELSGTKP